MVLCPYAPALHNTKRWLRGWRLGQESGRETRERIIARMTNTTQYCWGVHIKATNASKGRYKVWLSVSVLRA